MFAMQVDKLSERPIGTADETLLIAEWTIPAPAAGSQPVALSPPHSHPHDEEAWYVVDGRLEVTLDDETVIVAAGGAAVAGAGTKHMLLNPGPGPCRYVLIARHIPPKRKPWHSLRRLLRPERIETVSKDDAPRRAAEVKARSDAARTAAERKRS